MTYQDYLEQGSGVNDKDEYCPECGEDIDLFFEKCPECGFDYTDLEFEREFKLPSRDYVKEWEGVKNYEK